MKLVTPAVFLALVMQLYYLYTCTLYWIFMSDHPRFFAHRHFDENLLDALAIAKVVMAPVSGLLLGLKPRLGKIFTGVLFLVYGLGGLAMPIFVVGNNPKAWWANTSSLGEGPLISLVWLTLGLVLVFHERIIRSQADPPPQPPAPSPTSSQ